MIKVKICGVTNFEDAQMASFYGADAIGFIFSKKSPRCISEPAAKKIIKGLDPYLTKVGVFLDQDKDKVKKIATNLNLDVLQFHGSEKPDYCKFFQSEFKIVKVFFPQDRPLDKKIARYNIDAYMFDVRYEQKTKGQNKLSKDMLKEISSLIKKGKRVIISGGLTPKNLTSIKKINPYAIDVASGVEKMVGKKDKDLVREFIKKAKHESS